MTDPRPPAGPATSAPAHPGGLRVLRRDGVVVHHGVAEQTSAVALDLLVETVCELLDVDYAGVHLVDDTEHHVLATSQPSPREPLPRFDTLCGVLLARYAAVPLPGEGPQVLEVPDTAADPTLPVVTLTSEESAPVRFYAAAPLTAPDGRVRGTLCAIAHHPRTLTDLERRTLLLLGVAASTLLAGCSPSHGG